MILALSSLALEREVPSAEAMAARTVALGYRGFELNLGTPLVPLSLSRTGRAALRDAIAASGLERFGAHAPATDLNPISVNEAVRELTFDQYLRAAELARDLGASTLTVHLGVGGWPGFPKDLGRSLCIEFFHRLCERVGDGGPVLGLENVAWGPRDPFAEVDDLVAVLAALDPSRAGVTLDVGHARLAGLDAPGVVAALGERILNVHVHSNDGQEDWHWPLAEDDEPARRAAARLAESGFQGMVIHECAAEPGDADAFAARLAVHARA